MAFPTVAGTNTSTEGSATTSHSVSLPGSISAGDLLIVVFATDGDNTVTNWDGFTELWSASNGTANFLAVAYKIAAGGDTLTVTTSVSEPSAHASYRITGHEADTIPPEFSTGVSNGNDDSPDPDELIASWVQDDTLWIAACGIDRRTISGYPTNYGLSQLNPNSGGSGGCTAAMAGRNLNNTTQDPGVFTAAAIDTWCAVTIAVPPDGAVAGSAVLPSCGICKGIKKGIIFKVI